MKQVVDNKVELAQLQVRVFSFLARLDPEKRMDKADLFACVERVFRCEDAVNCVHAWSSMKKAS